MFEVCPIYLPKLAGTERLGRWIITYGVNTDNIPADPPRLPDLCICGLEFIAVLAALLRRPVKPIAVIGAAPVATPAAVPIPETTAVTAFWMRLRQFCKENYPNLNMVGEAAPKGASASWPEFRTSLSTIKVIYKSQKGYVDLEFPKYGDKTADLLSKIQGNMVASMQVWKTGKSASLRISNDRWILDFSQDFDNCKDTVCEVLQAVSTLCNFASSLNYSDLY